MSDWKSRESNRCQATTNSVEPITTFQAAIIAAGNCVPFSSHHPSLTSKVGTASCPLSGHIPGFDDMITQRWQTYVSNADIPGFLSNLLQAHGGWFTAGWCALSAGNQYLTWILLAFGVSHSVLHRESLLETFLNLLSHVFPPRFECLCQSSI